MVICPDCGKEVKDAKFCSNCGSRLPKVVDVVSEEVETKIEIPVEEESTEEFIEEVVGEETVEEETPDVPVVGEVGDEETASEEEEIKVNVKTKFCANCGTKVPREAAFCPECGYKFGNEEKPQSKFCQNCGKKIDVNAEICPHCGVRVVNFRSSEGKSVFLSVILSFILPGLGHIYLGLNKKGVSFIIAYVISGILTLIFIGYVLTLIFWIWALVDSIKSTEAINRGEFVEDKLF